VKLKLQKYKAVIFDMDGVIADTNPFHKLAWQKFAEKYSLSISDENLKENIYGRTNGEIFRYLFNKALSKTEIMKLSDEKESIFRIIYKGHTKPVKGLINFLELLKKEKIKIGVATSAPTENVEFILNELRIKPYFEAVIDPSKVSKSKPDPEIYLKTAELLKVNPADCLVFEDSIPGINAAVSAGMKVIGVTTTFPKNKLKCTDAINDFDDIIFI
jgi:beta-phosphoglucomutase